jgi:hypothetical protein
MADDNLDILRGMRAICAYLQIPERQGYEMAESGRLAVFKFPGEKIWHGRKSTLLRQVEGLEETGVATGPNTPQAGDPT